MVCGDCLEWMGEIDDESIDMILCDLPYGVTARNTWDVIIPFDELWAHYERIIKGNGAIVLTATEPFSAKLVNSNSKLFRYDLIWSKPMATGFLNANRMPLRSHEQVLVFYKSLPVYNPQKTPGKPYKMRQRDKQTPNYNKLRLKNPETNNETGDRYPVSIVEFTHDNTKLHPTQKPLALFEYLIKTYTNEGDLVLDNCAGSGTTGIACVRTGRRFILIDSSPVYCGVFYDRLDRYQKEHVEGYGHV